MKLRNLRKTEQKEKRKKRGIKNQLKAIDELKSSDERESNLFSLQKIREIEEQLKKYIEFNCRNSTEHKSR